MSERIGILGYGVTGQSVARFLVEQGYEIDVVDTRPPQDDAPRLPGAAYHWRASQWPNLDLKRAILSPGLALDACIVTSARRAGVEFQSDIDLFFESVEKPVIGITGTNGKSTVTSLVAHLLAHSGIHSVAAGNLGLAALDSIADDVDVYVLELSSFQLERSRELSLSAAAILNFSEDHLDQHGNAAAYLAAKQRIYSRAQRCVYNLDDASTMPEAAGEAVSFGFHPDSDWTVTARDDGDWLSHLGAPLVRVADLPLAGRHNVANILAAFALTETWLSPAQMIDALQSFTGLDHRFERVARHGGVTYINDSKATNVGAVIAGLAEFQPNTVVLIAGGDAKGADLKSLGPALERAAKAVACIGQDGPQILALAQEHGVTARLFETLEQAVRGAADWAESGDTVLLSPACASWDMFDSYKARGDRFTAAVLSELAGVADV